MEETYRKVPDKSNEQRRVLSTKVQTIEVRDKGEAEAVFSSLLGLSCNKHESVRAYG